MMNNWIITDPSVREALQQNGFICREPEEKRIPGAIHFYTQPKPSQPSVWYETDCPIKWNGRYTLPDGRTLVLHETTLTFADDEEKSI